MKYSSCCDIEKVQILISVILSTTGCIVQAVYSLLRNIRGITPPFFRLFLLFYLLDISCLFFLIFKLRISSLCFCYLLYFEAIECLNGDYDPGQTRLDVPSCDLSRDQETKRVPN